MNNTAIKEWQSVADFPGNNTPLIIDKTHYEVLTSLRLDSSYTIGSLFENKNRIIKTQRNELKLDLTFIDLTKDNKSNFSILFNNSDKEQRKSVGYNNHQWYIMENNNMHFFSETLPEYEEMNELSLYIDIHSNLSLIMNGNEIINQYKMENLYEDIIEKKIDINLSLISSENLATKIAIKKETEKNIQINNSNSDKYNMKQDQQKTTEIDFLETETLKVVIDRTFPRVIRYEYKGNSLHGELEPIKKLKINNHVIEPKVKYKKESNSKAIYTLKYQSDNKKLDFSIDIAFNVIKNEFHLDFIKINEKEQKQNVIESIQFIDNALISGSSNEENVQFAGSTMSVNTHHSGDVFMNISEKISSEKFGIMYGFISNNKLAAGVWSNSQYSFGGLTEDHTRLFVKTLAEETENTIKIASSPWYFHRKYKDEPYPDRTKLLPSAKVVITDDLNNDGKVDWQDAAIAYREIMNNPHGYKKVPELVNYRINMNFGSQAQNPFLKVLDGIKRVSLNTDGLGQSVLLKGYGNEGHDSGHLNYTDVGERMGGYEDFKFLMDRAKKYQTDLGVHINISETYPESPIISEELLRKTHIGQYKYGWNWIDQGINIDSAYDLLHSRYNRLKEFKKLTEDGLDFIYVDVWGNFQSGDERAWRTHQVAQELNSLDWRFALEWGFAGEYDSVFNHWAVDMPYGGYSLKGVNSKIARFIRNHQKDTWIGDYPKYGGAANNPLLGGYELTGFEGWQGLNNFKSYINTTFKTNLPTKFIQHFKVNKWIDGEPIQMTDNDEVYYWTPEMEVHLKDAEDNHLLIKRKSNDVKSPLYRQRTFLLNDKKVFDNDSYLLPWFWDFSGEKLAQNKQKLYYYSLNNHNTVWDVSLYNIKNNHLFAYELSDKGKINETKILIHDGKVNLDLKANTPYVIYSEPQKEPKIQWSEGMHIEDSNFNSLSLDNWEISQEKDKAKIVYSQGYHPMLEIKNNKQKISLKQKLRKLKPNTQYAAYVGVDNRSKAKASLKIIDQKNILENYTNKSIAKNYVSAYAYNTADNNATFDNLSYFQNMYVFFSTNNDPTNVFLEISREPGMNPTFFADIRILENTSKMFDETHETQDPNVFKQNFENVPQGIFPFVVGGSEGVEDNRIHLSEKNEPYTQRGWNEKLISDVIKGRWSLKANGLVEKDNIIYQTIPQNYRFTPGREYEIEFDYEAGSDDVYAFVIGEGEFKDKNNLEIYSLKNTWKENSEAKKMKVNLTGASSGQTWIGIYSTKTKAQTFEDTGGHAVFKSYSDLVIDNLKIRKI